jgi:FAD binding domain
MSEYSPLTPPLIAELRALLGNEASINADPKQLKLWSRDHYWYSPVLRPLLDDKSAEVSVQPRTLEALIGVIAFAVRQNVPITMRGAGTGNYGQGVPMHGGILLDTKALSGIVELTRDQMRVQAGAKMIDMERAANTVDAELRFYPSTLLTATAGGFLAGGSVTYGTLWDEGNVLGATVVTIEAVPRVLTISDPEQLLGVVHNCGLTCVIADLTFALGPKRPWEEYAVVFDDFDSALTFASDLAYDDAVHKRLITVFEPGIVAHLKQLPRIGAAVEGKALVLLELSNADAVMRASAADYGGEVTLHHAHERYHAGGMMLSDFTWNHTTLWAMKSDESMTYLQDMFDPARVFEQHHARKARFGDNVLTHIEFMRFKGKLVPQGLSLVKYESKEQLWEIMDWCEANGMWVANPHTHRLDEDVRWNGQPILDAKQRWDPLGLLNPGHLGE